MQLDLFNTEEELRIMKLEKICSKLRGSRIKKGIQDIIKKLKKEKE